MRRIIISSLPPCLATQGFVVVFIFFYFTHNEKRQNNPGLSGRCRRRRHLIVWSSPFIYYRKKGKKKLKILPRTYTRNVFGAADSSEGLLFSPFGVHILIIKMTTKVASFCSISPSCIQKYCITIITLFYSKMSTPTHIDIIKNYPDSDISGVHAAISVYKMCCIINIIIL